MVSAVVEFQRLRREGGKTSWRDQSHPRLVQLKAHEPTIGMASQKTFLGWVAVSCSLKDLCKLVNAGFSDDMSCT